MKRAIFTLSILLFGCPSGDSPKTDQEKPSTPAADSRGQNPEPEPAGDEGVAAVPPDSPLRNPALAKETAPATYRVKFETTKGEFIVNVTRDWAPGGADRFYNLVKIGFYDDVAFFRAIKGFMAQFGIHGDPSITRVWQKATFPDDPVTSSNTEGKVSFATRGANSRTTQVFINYGDNNGLDGMGFAPFGEVVEGMDVVNSLHTGYGEGQPGGVGPAQNKINQEGNAYLRKSFPELDWTKKVSIVP